MPDVLNRMDLQQKFRLNDVNGQILYAEYMVREARGARYMYSSAFWPILL
jgi:hypothetical protein